MNTKGTQGNLTRIILLTGTAFSLPSPGYIEVPQYDSIKIESDAEKTVMNSFFRYDQIENKLTILDRNIMLEEPVMKLRIIGKLKVKIKKGEPLKYVAVENSEGFI